MASAEELGIDDRAFDLLSQLPAEKQQVALDKLAAGKAARKVRNASAFLVGVLNGPDLLDLDDNALKLLNDLPVESRKAVIEKLRKTADVRNPSAWVARAAMTAMRESAPAPQGGQRGGLASPPPALMRAPALPAPRAYGLADQIGSRLAALDPQSKDLLQSLPLQDQQEILGRLMIQRDVKNPSAWVAKAAKQAGAGGAGASSQLALTGADELEPAVLDLLQQGEKEVYLDSGATSMLRSLPLDTQLDIVGKMMAQDGIKNPSGWLVKACLAASSSQTQSTQQSFSSTSLHGAHVDLDEGAKQMLAKLPPADQREILRKLDNTPDVKNPSAWVVKAILQVGGSSQHAPSHHAPSHHAPIHYAPSHHAPSHRAPSQAAAIGSVAAAFRSVIGGLAQRQPALPKMLPNVDLDQKALSLLQSLPDASQQEIIRKLTNSVNEGKVQNPSAWVVKACLNSGAQGASSGPQGRLGGSFRASPY